MSARAHLYPTPGAIVSLDARTGEELWRVATPTADYNEIYWVHRRLIVRATGSAYDRCDRYSDYLVVNRGSGATTEVSEKAGEPDSSGDALAREGFPPLVGEVRFGRRSYETEIAEDFDHSLVRATTIVITGPGRLDYRVREFWSVPRPEGIIPVATDGKVVLLAPPGNVAPPPAGIKDLRALDTRNGHTLWTLPLRGFGTDPYAYDDYPRPILSNGLVYAMTTRRTLSALNARTGRVAFAAKVRPGAIAVSRGGVAVLSPGHVSFIGRDGQIEWTHDVEARTSGIALDEHRVYLAVNGRHPSVLFCPAS